MGRLRFWLSDAFVFFPGGHAAADVALGLVHVQYRFYLIVQRAVEFRQTFAQIFMYGRG